MASLKPVTAGLLAQIRDNLAGISAGGAVDDYPVQTGAFNSGALNATTNIVPGSIDGGVKIIGANITQAKIQSSAVGFNNIKIGTNTVLAASGAIATGAVTSAAGIYILGWESSCVVGSGTNGKYQCGPGSGETAGNAAQNWLSNTAPETHFWVYERSGAAGAYAQVTWTYIASSPPWQLAGEEVPVFVFAVQRADGSLRSVMVMDDAPWSPGAPTEIRSGKPWIRRRRPLTFGRLDDHASRQAILRRLREPVEEDFEEFEITLQSKNRDMGKMPHPFPDLQPGERVVLIDPVGAIARDLAEAHRSKEAGFLVAGGDIVLGEVYTLPEQPPGVTLLRAGWR